jgi:hypothetical protein
MLRNMILLSVAGLALAACTPPQYTFAEARALCEDKADAARGPQGNVAIGVGTGGPSFSAGISISDSYIRGDDPDAVYARCMNDLEQNGQIIGAPS